MIFFAVFLGTPPSPAHIPPNGGFCRFYSWYFSVLLYRNCIMLSVEEQFHTSMHTRITYNRRNVPQNGNRQLIFRTRNVSIWAGCYRCTLLRAQKSVLQLFLLFSGILVKICLVLFSYIIVQVRYRVMHVSLCVDMHMQFIKVYFFVSIRCSNKCF